MERGQQVCCQLLPTSPREPMLVSMSSRMLAGFLAQKAIYCVTVSFYLDERKEASTSTANCNESESDNEMPDALSTLTESLATIASGKVSYCDYSNSAKKYFLIGSIGSQG